MDLLKSDMKPLPTFEDDILSHVQKEVLYGLETIKEKRNIFRRRLKSYIEPNKGDDKIGINTLYATMQLHLALSTSDELTVQFKPRGIGDEEYAENINSLAAFDRDEMGLDQIEHQHHWDRGFFGFSARVLDGWNEDTNTPVFTIKDPMGWIPDPLGNHVDPFRFHYFEELMPRSLMTSEYGFDEAAVDSIEAEKGELTDEQKTTRSEFYNKQGISEQDDDTDNGMYPVINGYTEKGGKLFLVTISRDGLTLLRKQEIKPGKKGKAYFPVVISYFSPLRGDPTGVSICDLVEDKQRAESILANLRLIDAKFNTLGQTFVYDGRAIKNRNDLTAPTTNPKWIAINPDSGVSPANAIYPVPRTSIMADSFNVSQELRQQIQQDTGISAQSLGVSGDKSMTLGESQQIQANANVRLGLSIRVASWSEKKFWGMWFDAYRENFSGSKFIRVVTTYGTNVVEIRPKDLECATDPDIYVQFKSQANALNEKEKAAFMANLSLILGNPNSPRISKDFAQRKALRLSGMRRDEVYAMVPKTAEEMDADDAVQLINRGTFPSSIFDGEQKDWQTYLVVLQSAIDNPVKFKTIEKVKNMIILTGKQQPSAATPGVANSAASQLVSSQISQGNANQVETVAGALQ